MNNDDDSNLHSMTKLSGWLRYWLYSKFYWKFYRNGLLRDKRRRHTCTFSCNLQHNAFAKVNLFISLYGNASITVSRQGGGRARGRDLTRKYIPWKGNLTINTVPGAGVFDKFEKKIGGHFVVSHMAYVNNVCKWAGTQLDLRNINGTSGVNVCHQHVFTSVLQNGGECRMWQVLILSLIWIFMNGFLFIFITNWIKPFLSCILLFSK